MKIINNYSPYEVQARKILLSEIKKGYYQIVLEYDALKKDFDYYVKFSLNKRQDYNEIACIEYMNTDCLIELKKSLKDNKNNKNEHYIRTYDYFIDFIDSILIKKQEPLAKLGAIL
jgi:hypothetical protein